MDPERNTNQKGLGHLDSWGVIFDMDGVLIDSYRAHFLSWKRMLAKHGLDITEEEFASTFGQTNHDILARLFPSIDERDYNTLAKEKEHLFREIIRRDFPEMGGAKELISHLHEAGALLAIGSSAPRENVHTVLEMIPGGQYFRAVTCGDEITRGKPDPEVFLKTARKMGLPPQRCVVVEDAPAGVKAARSAGCAVIAFTGTAPREYLLEADLVVDSLRDLTPDDFLRLVSTSRLKQ
ncbi:MAG: HAD family phosphatase [Deltaproteobacteria bacterium]|nr:HAD family phosphatase [Deltaproteobacteria bacterium]